MAGGRRGDRGVHRGHLRSGGDGLAGAGATRTGGRVVADGTRAVGTGERDTLDLLLAQQAAPLRGFVVRLLDGDVSAAQDVVQETFLRAWQHPAALSPGTGPARAWLFTVAKNLVIDERRRERRRRELIAARPLGPTVLADPTTGLADHDLVIAALERLTAEHRAVLIECYYRGRSVAEAATELRVPPGTVKSRTHYALHSMRHALEDLGWQR